MEDGLLLAACVAAVVAAVLPYLLGIALVVLVQWAWVVGVLAAGRAVERRFSAQREVRHRTERNEAIRDVVMIRQRAVARMRQETRARVSGGPVRESRRR